MTPTQRGIRRGYELRRATNPPVAMSRRQEHAALPAQGSLPRQHRAGRQDGCQAKAQRCLWQHEFPEASFSEDALTHLRSHYTHKLEALSEAIDGTGDERFDGHTPLEAQLRQEVLATERAAVIRLRDRGRIDDETLRLVERELDLEEQRWR